LLKAAIAVANLPAKAAVSVLKQAGNPAVVEALSTAIAKGSFQAVDSEGSVSIENLDIQIIWDEERLLTTGGLATAISLGTVFWLGSKLQIRIRYAAMIKALEELKTAIALADNVRVSKALDTVDLISDPLLDPITFKPIENADEVADIYQALFNTPAEAGSMFKASTFTATIDDAVKLGSRAGVLIASEATEEALEAITKKAAPIAGKVAGRALGAVLWVDTIWWLATSAIDIGLNYTGIAEEDQKIPILSDIPFIGGLFDLSESVGSSALDLVITPVVDGIIDFFFPEEIQESVFDVLWGVITAAAANPTIAPFIIAILDFYIDRIDIDVNVPASWDLENLDFEYQLDLFGFRPDPTDILILWFYAISAKIVFNSWIIPAWLNLTARQ
jgi:hypothetical protein